MTSLCYCWLSFCILYYYVVCFNWNETKRNERRRRRRRGSSLACSRALANGSNSYQQPYNSSCVSNTIQCVCVVFFSSFRYFFSTFFFTFLKRKFSSKWWVRLNTYSKHWTQVANGFFLFDTENYIFLIWMFQGFQGIRFENAGAI